MTGLAGSICRELAVGLAAVIFLAVETCATGRFAIDRVKTEVEPAATTGYRSENPASLIHFNLPTARRVENHFFLRGKSSGVGQYISQTHSQIANTPPTRPETLACGQPGRDVHSRQIKMLIDIKKRHPTLAVLSHAIQPDELTKKGSVPC